MTNKTHRSKRGWLMVLFLLCGGIGIFSYVQGPAVLDYPLWKSEPEHLLIKMPPVPPKAPICLATDSLSEFETNPNLDKSNWLNYRSRPTTSSIALLEPQAGVRLLAPQADINDSRISRIANSNRTIENTFDTSTNVTAVSSARPAHREIALPTTSDISNTAFDKSKSLWPYPQNLMTSLQAFATNANEATDVGLATWAQDIEHSIATLRSSERSEVAFELDRLQDLATIGLSIEPESNPPSNLDESRMQISHSLIRRLAIWKAVWDCVAEREVAAERPAFEVARLASALTQLQVELTRTSDAAGWSKYLMLDELQAMIDGQPEAMALAGQTAQVVLGRITSINVSETQRRFLDSGSVRELVDSIHPLAISPVNYARLLADLEMVEADAEHRSFQTLVDAMQSLRFAEDVSQVALSSAIDIYYRNANVRIAVSQRFINRMLPTSKTIQRPVHQNVLGADTRGSSDVVTNVALQLVPNEQAWQMNLKVNGDVKSKTRSSRGPAVLFNASNAHFDASRNILITPQGIKVESQPTQVESQDALRGVETAYDGLPFIGELVRYKVHEEFKEKRGPARKIMQRTIAKQTDAEIDKLLDTQIETAELKLESRLLGPLRNLNLNPLVTDLRTTQDRLIARYRIASDNALAANSPRPQAPSDALISIQLHQSALNNGFSSFGLSEREWTLLELAQSLAQQFGQEPIEELPGDVPSDVRIRFAGQRPILVEFKNGRLELTLNFALFTQPGRIELTDFVVRTNYIPRVDTLDADLLLEGAPSIDGDRISFRERLPLRAIFGKIFASRATIPLMNSTLKNDPRAEGLAISQVILEQGWMAVAVSEETSPHVALVRDRSLVR
jgi:hypothetical protein